VVATYPPGPLPAQDAADIAASFQQAVAETLSDRAAHAMAMFATDHAPSALVVAGGVAANATLRDALSAAAARAGFRFTAPPLRLCTDNAVMVAWAALERLRQGWTDELNHAPRPRWPLDSADMKPAA
jgi:N6-L-threonylcarbamoyladenine synthase